jgi:hypothetical protein
VRIKTGKPQPPSSSPITIEDAPTSPKERSPSKISVTYERGSPKTTTWKERMDQGWLQKLGYRMLKPFYRKPWPGLRRQRMEGEGTLITTKGG